jgi:pantothenate kinase type III
MIEMISKEQNCDFQIIITGGDASLLSENLNINAVVEPNLVLQGLNMILDYNIKKRDA